MSRFVSQILYSYRFKWVLARYVLFVIAIVLLFDLITAIRRYMGHYPPERYHRAKVLQTTTGVSRSSGMSGPESSGKHQAEPVYDLDVKRDRVQSALDDTRDLIDRELAKRP